MIIYKNKILRKDRRILAIFDIDWTIIKPKTNEIFPKNKDDWRWLNDSVPSVLKRLNRNDYRIVFLTDQSKEWKVEMIKDVIKELNIPVICLIAFKKDFYKPNPTFFLETFNNKYDKSKSFFVGDAAGRKGDWSDKDKKLAENIDVKFFTPEEIFKNKNKDNNKDKKEKEKVKTKNEKEIVIMIGYPGSGKTTFAKKLCDNDNRYIRIDGDIYKTPVKMIKEAEKYIKTNSIIFDATNGTKERREYFINFAKLNNLPVRCIWNTTTIDKAMEQNKERAKNGGIRIPDIVFYVYRKKFQEPTANECEIIKID